MKRWRVELKQRLAERSASHLRRHLRPMEADGPWAHTEEAEATPLLNLSANDYLGLARHPRLAEAAAHAAREEGTGSAASRLLTGTRPAHAALERRFAALKSAETALLCPTGYMANHALLTTLAGPGDRICLDKLAHASLIDAAQASGAEVRAFPHRNLQKLERLLARPLRGAAASDTRQRPPRQVIVTDSVFSMDGDIADLPGLCELAEQYEAVLGVDEAHGTGVLGPGGAGLCAHQGVEERVDAVVSTGSKALGGLGGLITGPKVLTESIANEARGFIYTTAVPAPQIAALEAALDVLKEEPWRKARLERLARKLREGAAERGWDIDPSEPATPIVPMVVGTKEDALALEAHLRAHGVLAPAIRPPTVAPGAARVRLSLRADLSEDDLERLWTALDAWARGARAIP